MARPLANVVREQPRRVAVFRALQLGDLLCAVPAFRALRAALPNAEIVLVGLPWAHAFVARFARYLDGFRAFPGFPGLPEQPPRLNEIPPFLAALQAERFDLALQLHGSGVRTNAIVELFGARHNAGYYAPGQHCPDEERFWPYPDDEHEVRKHLRLLEALGVPSRGEAIEFPLNADDERDWQQLPEARELTPGSYVCVHPGARGVARRWPPESFAAVADALAATGRRVVLTGSRDEAALTRAVAARMHAPCLDLAGRTSLGALGVLLSGAALLVSNNTGVMHLAAGLRVPSVTLFHEEAERDRWAPLDTERHRVVLGFGPDSVAAALDHAHALLGRDPVSARPSDSPACLSTTTR